MKTRLLTVFFLACAAADSTQEQSPIGSATLAVDSKPKWALALVTQTSWGDGEHDTLTAPMTFTELEEVTPDLYIARLQTKRGDFEADAEVTLEKRVTWQLTARMTRVALGGVVQNDAPVYTAELPTPNRFVGTSLASASYPAGILWPMGPEGKQRAALYLSTCAGRGVDEWKEDARTECKDSAVDCGGFTVAQAEHTLDPLENIDPEALAIGTENKSTELLPKNAPQLAHILKVIRDHGWQFGIPDGTRYAKVDSPSRRPALRITFTKEGRQRAFEGDFPELLCLDRTYRGRLDDDRITFELPLAVESLRSLYAALPHVLSVEVEAAAAIDSDVCISTEPDGDYVTILYKRTEFCENGCHYYSRLDTEDGRFVSRGFYSDDGSKPVPDWLRNAPACTDYLSRVPNRP